MFILSGKKISLDATITIAGQTFPPGFFYDVAARTEYGITEVADPVREDDRFYFITENEDGTLVQTPKDIVGLREGALIQVKEIRRQYLDKFVLSPGVSEVYNENLDAVRDVVSGPGTKVMRSGVTSTAYCTAMSTKLGMTVPDYCAYIQTENQTASQKAQQIEEQYLDVAYVQIPAADFAAIQTIVSSFVAFCETVLPPV